jgi:hypothetical protein
MRERGQPENSFFIIHVADSIPVQPVPGVRCELHVFYFTVANASLITAIEKFLILVAVHD